MSGRSVDTEQVQTTEAGVDGEANAAAACRMTKTVLGVDALAGWTCL